MVYLDKIRHKQLVEVRLLAELVRHKVQRLVLSPILEKKAMARRW